MLMMLSLMLNLINVIKNKQTTNDENVEVFFLLMDKAESLGRDATWATSMTHFCPDGNSL